MVLQDFVSKKELNLFLTKLGIGLWKNCNQLFYMPFGLFVDLFVLFADVL